MNKTTKLAIYQTIKDTLLVLIGGSIATSLITAVIFAISYMTAHIGPEFALTALIVLTLVPIVCVAAHGSYKTNLKFLKIEQDAKKMSDILAKRDKK